MSRRSSPAGIGACTVLTILLVLCLSVFAALTLASAGADLRLSEAAAQRTQEYYAADAEAARVYAAFAAGSAPSLEADIPVGSAQQLQLVLSRGPDGSPVIESWRVTVPEELPDTSLPVWTGELGGAD